MSTQLAAVAAENERKSAIIRSKIPLNAAGWEPSRCCWRRRSVTALRSARKSWAACRQSGNSASRCCPTKAGFEPTRGTLWRWICGCGPGPARSAVPRPRRAQPDSIRAQGLLKGAPPCPLYGRPGDTGVRTVSATALQWCWRWKPPCAQRASFSSDPTTGSGSRTPSRPRSARSRRQQTSRTSRIRVES